MGTISPCLKGNHKPKAPHLPKCAPATPAKPQPVPRAGLSKPSLCSAPRVRAWN